MKTSDNINKLKRLYRSLSIRGARAEQNAKWCAILKRIRTIWQNKHSAILVRAKLVTPKPIGKMHVEITPVCTFRERLGRACAPGGVEWPRSVREPDMT